MNITFTEKKIYFWMLCSPARKPGTSRSCVRPPPHTKPTASVRLQGYRTGYAYRFPVQSERTRTRREVEVPASAISFSHLEEEGGLHHLGLQRQQPYAQRQQQERSRWLNTPNTYQKVNQEQASPGHHQRSTTVRTRHRQRECLGSATVPRRRNGRTMQTPRRSPKPVLVLRRVLGS